ncbi:MAG: 30S ribosome-binding factor RbfA [Halothiobacillaceae bacterium]
MARDFPRARRVAEQIQRELAELIRDEINDPRIGLLTITDVEVSRDLAHAKVYFSTLASEERAVAQEVLDGAAGFLRAEIGARMRLRVVPQLHFLHDDSIERGMRMDALIDSVRAEDRARRPDGDEE